MSVEVIQKKLLDYQCKNIVEQENALKEIAQEIALVALSRAGFFRVAAFHGGACLRILHGLERFSEDLDFVLLKADKNFDWKHYIHNMQEEFQAYGYTLEAVNKTKVDQVVKKAFLKAESQGGLLVLRDTRTNRPKIQIKLEIETNPPAGSNCELKFLDFPLVYSVQTQDIPSLFAGKMHALLCREYIKGRDWYDFIWYVSNKVIPNFSLLSAAINQSGPWQGQTVSVSLEWILEQLKIKINNLDWVTARQDVARFLKDRQLPTLEFWSTEFFLSRVDKLADYLSKDKI